ncbi:MAG: hypothetical protein ACP5U1_17240 [Desulfomonilaceae bacterium]
MKTIVSVHDAVGSALCHDITEVSPGKFKGRAFKKGHIVRPSDVPKLLNLGKEHLYVLKMKPGVIFCAHVHSAFNRFRDSDTWATHSMGYCKSGVIFMYRSGPKV